VPLSEHEQRVLHQIERQFSQDRGLVRSLGGPEDARHALRNVRWAAAGFVLGLLTLSLCFASSWVVGLLAGLIGFVLMLASAMVVVQSLRWLARDRWAKLLVEHGGRPVPGRAPGPRPPWRGRPRGGDRDGAA
jgi:hypothetical protein